MRVLALVGIALSVLTFPSVLRAQEDTTTGHLLRWKVPNETAVAYRYVMKPTGKKDRLFEIDGDELFKMFEGFIESSGVEGKALSKEASEAMKEFFGNFKVPEEFSMTLALLGKENDRIGVTIVVSNPPELTAGPKEFQEMFKKASSGVQLRGEIDSAGRITSFWLQQRQKNLLALLCQLPERRVSVGDAWAVDVSMLEMGNGFEAKKARRANTVKLTALEEVDKHGTVATIDYFIVDAVEGDFTNPFAKKTTPTSMSCSFAGRGRFSIPKGKWISFSARMRIKATGIMNSDIEQLFALEEIAEAQKPKKER